MVTSEASGVVHAGEPRTGTSVCGGLVLELDAEGRSFVPWAEGACVRCSESLDPTAAPTPPESADPAHRAVEDSATIEEAAARVDEVRQADDR